MEKHIKITTTCLRCLNKLPTQYLIIRVPSNFSIKDIELEVKKNATNRCSKHPETKPQITYSFYHEVNL